MGHFCERKFDQESSFGVHWEELVLDCIRKSVNSVAPNFPLFDGWLRNSSPMPLS